MLAVHFYAKVIIATINSNIENKIIHWKRA